MASFAIRRLASGDEPLLRAARLRAFADAPRAFGSTLEREQARTPEDWRRWMALGAVYLLDADAESGPRGIIAVGIEAPALGRISSMWVEPELRGCGGAEALLAHALAWARNERVEKIVLSVVKANTRARRFYERNGFIPTGREIVGPITGNLEIEMQRDL